MKKYKHIISEAGFTIIELIIVIIVIGILTTITIVSYKEITDRTHISAIQNDLSAATAQLEKYNYSNSSFPVAANLTNDGTGIKTTNGTIYDYKYYPFDNTYCLGGTNYGMNYYVSSNNHKPRLGSCPANTYAKAWGGAGDDGAKAISNTSDGGYVITGTASGLGAGGYDVLIMKYDAFGNIQWKKTWGGAGDDNGYNVIQTMDGGYVVAGFTYNGANDYDAFLLKYDKAGSYSWCKRWGGALKDYSRGLYQLNDGSIVVTSGTLSYGAGGRDLLLQKFDSMGNISWSKTWGGAQDDWGYGVLQTPDGGFAIAGTVQSYNGTFEAYIMKLDNNFNIAWCKSWGGSGIDFGHAFIQTTESSNVYYYMTGDTNSYGSGNADMFLVKYDNSGNLVWNRTWGGSAADVGTSIVQSVDGYIMVSGITSSYGSTKDTFTSKFDTNGNLIWSTKFASNSNPNTLYLERFADMVNASYGGFAISTDISGYGAGSYDMLLLKMDSSGNIAGCSTLCQSLSVTPGNPSVTLGNPVYPFVTRSITPADYSVTSTDQNGTTTTVVTPQFQ